MGVLLAKFPELSQGRGGLAGVNRIGAEGDAFLEIDCEARGDESRRGVKKNDIAARAGDAGKHVVEQRSIGRDVAAGKTRPA